MLNPPVHDATRRHLFHWPLKVNAARLIKLHRKVSAGALHDHICVQQSPGAQ